MKIIRFLRKLSMVKKYISGKVEINYGADNFCYIWSKNGKRVNLTEWMKKFDGKDVEIDVFEEFPQRRMKNE